MREGSCRVVLAASPERRCPAADDAGDGVERRLESAPAALAEAEHAAARGQLQSLITAAWIELADFEVVDEYLSFSSRHNGGRARSGAASRRAAAASKMPSSSAPAFRCDAPCQRAFTACPARNICLHGAFRLWHVKAARAEHMKALGALRAISRLRACASDAFIARISRGAIRAVRCRGCQEPVRAVSGHSDGDGMVKT